MIRNKSTDKSLFNNSLEFDTPKTSAAQPGR